jgi:hypothetical protein
VVLGGGCWACASIWKLGGGGDRRAGPREAGGELGLGKQEVSWALGSRYAAGAARWQSGSGQRRLLRTGTADGVLELGATAVGRASAGLGAGRWR